MLRMHASEFSLCGARKVLFVVIQGPVMYDTMLMKLLYIVWNIYVSS